MRSKNGTKLARAIVMASEMLRRLRNREPGLDLGDPKWPARLALSMRWWDLHRLRYTYQLINEYGEPPIERDYRVEEVTQDFAHQMLAMREQPESGTLPTFFIYSGASGVGKSTMWDMLLHLYPDGPFRKFGMFTTREPRNGEADGREYHFVSPERLRTLATRKQALCCRMDKSLPAQSYNLLQGVPLTSDCVPNDSVSLRDAIEDQQAIWVLEAAPDLTAKVKTHITDAFRQHVSTFFVCPFSEDEFHCRSRACQLR